MNLHFDDGYDTRDTTVVPQGQPQADVDAGHAPSPSPGPHGAPTASPTVTTTPSPTVTTTTVPGGGGDQGVLPTTGPDATGLLVISAAVTLLGAALVAWAARMYRGRHAQG